MHRLLSSALACALALALAGCGKSEQAAQTAAQPATTPVASAATAGHQALTDEDQAFIAAATADGAFQLALGRMALEKSSTDQMHELAQRIVDDYARMNDDLASITGRGGGDQAVPAMPADKAQQLRNHLAPLQGDAFRNAFVDVTIHDHHLAVALFADEAKNGHDKALRNFARKELPALREHLAMAQAMLDAAGSAPSQSGA